MIWETRKTSTGGYIAQHYTLPFVSMGILSAWEKKKIIHTALDDLESFLWLLIWCIVHASKDIEGAKDANGGIQDMLNAWSGDLASNKSKLVAAQHDWDDAVFKDLIQEWLSIFRRASEEAERVVNRLPSIPLDNRQGSRWNYACDRLTSYCTDVYEEILKSGLNFLERIQDYPD